MDRTAVRISRTTMSVKRDGRDLLYGGHFHRQFGWPSLDDKTAHAFQKTKKGKKRRSFVQSTDIGLSTLPHHFLSVNHRCRSSAASLPFLPYSPLVLKH